MSIGLFLSGHDDEAGLAVFDVIADEEFGWELVARLSTVLSLELKVEAGLCCYWLVFPAQENRRDKEDNNGNNLMNFIGTPQNLFFYTRLVF